MILVRQKEMMVGLVQLLNLIIFHKDIKWTILYLYLMMKF
jgi:hypothetical protein